MPIKRVFAVKDNTITNAYKENLINTASLSNMGASDVLELFSIYGQANTSSVEKSRILIQFDINSFIQARNKGIEDLANHGYAGPGTIPASGSVDFFLRLFNAPHTETGGQSSQYFSDDKSFPIVVHPLDKRWEEGGGLDMETYKDLGASNWITASAYNRFTDAPDVTTWSTPGGDFTPGPGGSNTSTTARSYTTFQEDFTVDITHMVENWMQHIGDNYGCIVKLSGSYENGDRERSLHTKKFYARGSEFFFKRPIIEARWEPDASDPSLLPNPYVISDEYIFNIKNMKPSYTKDEYTRFRVHTRDKNWSPNIYTSAIQTSSVNLVSASFYKLTRVADNLTIIDYSTGSIYRQHSRLSYDAKGSYFDLDMSILESNYLYEISFLRQTGSSYIQQPEKFRFRVD